MKRRKAGAANVSNAPAEIVSAGAAEAAFTPATDEEIERERARWAGERRAEHLKFVRQFTFHTSTTFMDYLHGDVTDAEAWFACQYEYGRESRQMREAVRMRDEARAKGNLNCENDFQRILYQPGIESWIRVNLLAQRFLMCDCFPREDWNELGKAERKKIMLHHDTRKIPPMPMTDVWTLEGLGVFDKFKALAEEAKPVVEDHDPQRGKFARPYKPVPPLLQKRESVYHAVVDVDYSKSENQLVNEFREWLWLPENRERLAKYKVPTTGTTGKPLDRLKDLAAWRLYRECGNDWNKADEFARDNRKRFTSAEIREKYITKTQRKIFQPGSPKPFYNARRQDGKPSNEADLFDEIADAYRAQAGAWKYLAEIMPQEFAPPGPHMLAEFVGWEKLAAKG